MPGGPGGSPKLLLSPRPSALVAESAATFESALLAGRGRDWQQVDLPGSTKGLLVMEKGCHLLVSASVSLSL